MKITSSLSTVLLVLVSMMIPGVSAAWGWGSSTADEVKNEVEINDDTASVVTPTVVNSRTLQSIIDKEKRFVVYNSRRLTGECLPICSEENVPTAERTKSPTNSPISEGQEIPPTDSPTIIENTETGDPTDTPTKNPTALPTAKPSKKPTQPPTKPFDPGSFCRMENSVAWGSDSECSGKPGSCQMRSIDGKQSSCGPGVPAGFYPDLTRCDAYCKCTGTSAPSEYEIILPELEWDTHQQNNVYLDGVWGEDGAWGTDGGGPTWDWQMSIKGRDRPPNCGGPACADKNYHACNGCTQFYNCVTGSASSLSSCAGGTLFNAKGKNGYCDFASNMDCGEDNNGEGMLPCPFK